MAEKKQSVFDVLNAINCNEHVEKKNGLSYLSWAWAWQIVKKHYPEAFYTIYENGDGLFYHTDGRTAWVKTGVTINQQEYVEFLPVMDYKNRSIKLEAVTSFDVNTAIQRSLTKACARHGLGLYIYAGEDLPEEERAEQPKTRKPQPREDIIDTTAQPTTQPTARPTTQPTSSAASQHAAPSAASLPTPTTTAATTAATTPQPAASLTGLTDEEIQYVYELERLVDAHKYGLQDLGNCAQRLRNEGRWTEPMRNEFSRIRQQYKLG